MGVPGEHAEAAVAGGSEPTGKQSISSRHEMQMVLHLVAPNDNRVAYGISPILAGADKECLGTAPGCMAGRV